MEHEFEFGTDAHTLCRKGGVDTSKQAAFSLDTKSIESVVYNVILNHGPEGCISDEVRGHLSHLPYSSVTARYRSLLDKKYILDTGRRRKGESGRNQRVMVATKHFTGVAV